MKQNKLKNCNNVVCFKGEKVDGDRLQAAAVFFYFITQRQASLDWTQLLYIHTDNKSTALLFYQRRQTDSVNIPATVCYRQAINILCTLQVQ